MKICTIIGARPQFIKAATVSRALKNNTAISEVIIHTGQHYDKNMSDIFFEEMDIPKPKYNLNISGLSHGAMTGQMLQHIEGVLLKERPDWVLVYGDTNSTLAGALAAKKMHIKVAHVEAGLRSFNMAMPEEINRILTDDLSDILFCPTEQAIKNLLNEGKLSDKIVQTGDVMYDATLYYSHQIGERPKTLKFAPTTEFALCTIHRAENTDNLDRLRSIVEGLNQVNRKIKVVVPLHPRTRSILRNNNIQVQFELIDPVGYFDMLWLLKNTSFVVTDSGGLQKEAFFFGKYCFTLRDETEWVELVDNHFNTLVGADSEKLVDMVNAIQVGNIDFNVNLYGDGRAAEKIGAYFA